MIYLNFKPEYRLFLPLLQSASCEQKLPCSISLSPQDSIRGHAGQDFLAEVTITYKRSHLELEIQSVFLKSTQASPS